MGFYLRKSINLGGGVRLNLSNGGLGVSAGVKGFRVGANRKGSYVHVGRGGLYYRKNFSTPRQRPPSKITPRPRFDDQAPLEQSGNLTPPLLVEDVQATNTDIAEMFKPPIVPRIAKFFLVVGAILIFLNPAIGFFIVSLSGLTLSYFHYFKKKPILFYDLADEASASFQLFHESMTEFFKSERIWLYENMEQTPDWKRNAGASRLVRRRRAKFVEEAVDVESNVPLPTLSSGSDRIIFLPEMIVAITRGSIATFPYSKAYFRSELSQFVESEPVPSDAEVVGHTWKFVRRDGGPDRRFNGNRQVPVCRYQSFGLKVGNGFARLFEKSKQRDYEPLRRALSLLAKTNLREENGNLRVELLPAPSSV